MTTGIAEPSPAVPLGEPPAKNSFQRIAGVLFAPVDTFRDIARKPDILVPLIVLVVIGFLVTAVLVPRMDFETMMRTQMEQSGRNMPEADMQRSLKIMSSFGKVMAWAGPIWGILFYVIIAGVLLLAHRLMGGEGNFAQAFSATLYAWIPQAINSIIVAIVAFAKGEIDPSTMATLVKSNPAFLVDMKEHPVLFSALSSIDIFTIWTVILLIIGFAALSRFSKAKSAAIVISLWLVAIVVKLGFAALGAARMKKA